MEIHTEAAPASAAAPEEADELLQCRMSIQGLDILAIERDYPEVFEKLKRRCVACRCRSACTVDLERDPHNRVWEGYCPNSRVLTALVTLTEVASF
jgi:hypothetical protein